MIQPMTPGVSMSDPSDSDSHCGSSFHPARQNHAFMGGATAR
jgi:hypothetical protein